MAIRTTKPRDPNAPKLPPRAACDAIVRRFLKEDQNIEWGREMPKMYQLYKAYPSRAFWERHELPFGMHTLNHMSWFDSEEGKAHLESAWTLFHYTPPEPDPVPLLDTTGVDTTPQPAYHCTQARPKTVADFLRAKP